MPPKCPYCGAEFAGALAPGEALSGARLCPRCKKSFEFYLIERPYKALVPQLRDLGPNENAVAFPTAPVLPATGQEPRLAPAPIPPPTAPVAYTPLSPTYLEAVQQGQALDLAATPVDPSQLPPLAESACVNHPGNQATARCNNCSRAVCNLCATPVEGKTLCPQCFELLRARGALESSQRAFNTPNVALGLSIATLLLGWMYCLGFVLGPLAIYFSVRSFSEIDQRPELPGRRKAMAALIISVIGMVITLALVVLIIIGASMTTS